MRNDRRTAWQSRKTERPEAARENARTGATRADRVVSHGQANARDGGAPFGHPLVRPTGHLETRAPWKCARVARTTRRPARHRKATRRHAEVRDPACRALKHRRASAPASRGMRDPTPSDRRGAQYPTPNTQHSTLNTQHSTLKTQRQTPNAQRQAPNAQRQAPSTKRQAPSAKRETPHDRIQSSHLLAAPFNTAPSYTSRYALRTSPSTRAPGASVSLPRVVMTAPPPLSPTVPQT